jgi:hypothetical protein
VRLGRLPRLLIFAGASQRASNSCCADIELPPEPAVGMAGKNLRSANSRCHVRALVKKLNRKCVAEWVQVWIKFKEDLSVFHVYLT